MKYSLNLTVEFDSMNDMEQISHAVAEIARARGGRITGFSRNAYVNPEYPYQQLSVALPVTEEKPNEPAASDPKQPAAEGEAPPRTRKPRTPKPAVADATPAGAAAGADSGTDDATVDAAEETAGAGDATSGRAATSADAGGAEASWAEFVAAMNQISGKGIDVARKLLSDHGVARAIELKPDEFAAKRGKIVAAVAEAMK